MKTKIDYDDQLYSFYRYVMWAVCEIIKCWPHEVLDRCRTEPVSKARHVIAYILRKHVSRKNGVGGWTIAEIRPDGNVPISTTKVGSLLRMDHSAVVWGAKCVPDSYADEIDEQVWQEWAKNRTIYDSIQV